MSLGKHRSTRQHELFERALVPEHILSIEQLEQKDQRRDRPAVAVAPWQSVAAWVRLIGRYEAVMQCSGEHRQRMEGTIRTLTVERVRACRHIDDLERAEQLLVRNRYRDIAGLLACALPRCQLGELIVETRNRIAVLRLGRTAPKPKGPRFDPCRIPIDKIEALIQQHSDMAIVDLLRDERNRRLLDRP